MKNAFNWKFAIVALLAGLFLVGTLIYNFFWMDTAISSSGHATMSNWRPVTPDGSWGSFRWLILVAILLLVVLGGLHLVQQGWLVTPGLINAWDSVLWGKRQKRFLTSAILNREGLASPDTAGRAK